MIWRNHADILFQDFGIGKVETRYLKSRDIYELWQKVREA